MFKGILTGLVAGAAMLAAGAASADDWAPPGPLKVQIGFGAGGSTDSLGRVLAQTMKEQTGWNVIAENKPGGGGVAMFTGISKMPPRGNVIGIGVNMPIMINLVLRGDELQFDLDDFDYLGTVARAQLSIIAKGDAPFDDLAGLVAYSKENDGAPVAFDAKPQELILQAINKKSDAGLRPVSTESSAEMVKLVLGGQVVAGFAAGAHQQYLETGELKVIASANDSRLSYAPDVATVREQGYGVYVDPWFFLAAPAGLDPAAREALTRAVADAIASPAMAEVVANILKTEVDNVGPEGTKEMIVNGVENVKVLFGK